METCYCVESVSAALSLSFYLYFYRQDRDIEPEDFQRYTEKVQTSLQDCPVQRPPAALLSRHREHTSRAKQSQSHKVKGKEKTQMNTGFLGIYPSFACNDLGHPDVH